MLAAPSQTRTCNMALAYLGESHRINSIDDGTPLAKLFDQVWDEALREVLTDHPWNTALRRLNVPVSATYVPDGTQYTQAFEKPGDCLRWLPYRPDHPDYFAGEEEGDYILSNAAAPIVLRYIALVDDIAKWSEGMRTALAAKLAAKLAKPITGQTGMMDRMAKLYAEELSTAKRQDGAASGERGRGLVSRSDWLGARNRTWNGPVG